jgi:hypothetical protein
MENLQYEAAKTHQHKGCIKNLSQNSLIFVNLSDFVTLWQENFQSLTK